MRNKNPFLSLIRYLLFFLIGISLVVVGLWIVVVPESKIKEAIEGSINTNSLGIEVDGLKKGLFYNLNAERLTLKGRDGELIHIEDISGKVNPLYLFLLRVESSFNGRIQSGTISGNVNISRNKRFINVKLDNADIKHIPYMKSIGIEGTGLIDAKLTMENNKGTVKFAVNDAQFETSVFSGISIPLEIFDKAKGLVNIKGNEVEIESFSLEGNGIYGRIKGTIKNNVADMVLEIMPETSAQDKFPALMFMDKYKVSPGYYVIPIKKSL